MNVRSRTNTPTNGSGPSAPIEVDHLDELAAYIDGGLAPEHRRRVIDRLMHDEQYYRLFVDSLSFQLEHGSVRERIRAAYRRVAEALARAFRVRPIRTLATAAAPVVVVVAAIPIIIGHLSYNEGELLASIDAAAVLATSARDSWTTTGWSERRGGQYDWLTTPQRAFRAGVKSVQLEFAIQAPDELAAARAAAQLFELVDDPVAESLARSVQEQLTTADTKVLPALATELTTMLERSFSADQELAVRFDLGRWIETGRLASLGNHEELYAPSRWARQGKRLAEEQGDAALAAKLSRAIDLAQSSETETLVLLETLRGLYRELGG